MFNGAEYEVGGEGKAKRLTTVMCTAHSKTSFRTFTFSPAVLQPTSILNYPLALRRQTFSAELEHPAHGVGCFPSILTPDGNTA